MQNTGKEMYLEYLSEELDLVFEVNGLTKSEQEVSIYKENGKYFISDIWGEPTDEGEYFDIAHSFREGYALVGKEGKYNFINKAGKLISDRWFIEANDFAHGYACVKDYETNLWTLIDGEGNPINNKWFDVDQLWNFYHGYASVKKDGKYNFVNQNGDFISDIWFDDARTFEEGYAAVERNGLYTFIDGTGKPVNGKWIPDRNLEGCVAVRIDGVYTFVDKDGKPVNGKWFTANGLGDFHNGFAIAYTAEGSRFLNRNLEYISEAFDHANAFEGGYALVQKGDKQNYIDQKGNPISQNWFDSSARCYDFANGYARVYIDYKLNYINTKGETISDETFADGSDFNEYGYAVVRQNHRSYFIDTKANQVSEWFDEVGEFCNGVAEVRRDGRINYVDYSGRVINKIWADSVSKMSDELFILERGKTLNVANKDGLLLSDLWLDSDEHPHWRVIFNGLVLVARKGESDTVEWNFVDVNKNPISDTWYTEVEPKAYNNGIDGLIFAKVTKGGKWNYIDRNGKPLSDIWFDILENYNYDGVAIVKLDGKYNIIDEKCRLLADWTIKKPQKIFRSMESDFVTCYYSYATNDHGQLCYHKDFGNYKVKKVLRYTCTSDDDEFKLKYGYKPIKIYGSRYVLALRGEKIYIVDRTYDEYKYIGTVDDAFFSYDDHIICSSLESPVYFIYENELYDITEYYNKNELRYRNITAVNPGIKILTETEYIDNNLQAIEERRVLNRKIAEETKKAKEREENLQKIALAKAERERLIAERNKSIGSAVKHLDGLIKGEMIPITRRTPVDNLFVHVGYHKEIDPRYLNSIAYIDMSSYRFSNVDISGVDFSNSNIILNPQEVYKNNLKNCNFTGIHIEPFMDFTRVHIEGATFTSDYDPRTLEMVNPTFKESYYDEWTTYNGEKFVDIFGPCTKVPEKQNVNQVR